MRRSPNRTASRNAEERWSRSFASGCALRRRQCRQTDGPFASNHGRRSSFQWVIRRPSDIGDAQHWSVSGCSGCSPTAISSPSCAGVLCRQLDQTDQSELVSPHFYSLVNLALHCFLLLKSLSSSSCTSIVLFVAVWNSMLTFWKILLWLQLAPLFKILKFCRLWNLL